MNKMQPISKQDLALRKPLMNAAGTLGFAPDPRAPVPWDDFGAFVTNPISLRPRTAAAEPALIEYPGGMLLHSGLPNPGLNAALRKYGRRWMDSSLPVIVHLMADRPEETQKMVQNLEDQDNILAVELGFAPLLADDIILLVLEMCLGELPLIFNLPADQILQLGPRLVEAGAQAVSLAAPRGTLMENGKLISGRLLGPSQLPQSLEIVVSAARLGLPIIGAGGVYSPEDVQAMLAAGAFGVQMDTKLWLPGI